MIDKVKRLLLIDCTLRDGGYYNNWDFDDDLVNDYLMAMSALNVDYVEIGLRSFINKNFKGRFAFSSDEILEQLDIGDELKNKIGVMVNASELVHDQYSPQERLQGLFKPKKDSLVSLVRIACHTDEFAQVLCAADWLKENGYKVGFNLMQISECPEAEIAKLALLANEHPIDALYFADSLGSLMPDQIKRLVKIFASNWNGDIGIHTHDNMGQALANSQAAVEAGVTWVDGTVVGMGRGPGNVKTESLALALGAHRQVRYDITKLLEVIEKHFLPLQEKYKWGTNPYYFMAGQRGIHPTYVQEMLSDARFNVDDILVVLDHLQAEGGKKYRIDTLDAARHFHSNSAKGAWDPKSLFKGQEILLLGSGTGIQRHRHAIENFIKRNSPTVLALNTQSAIAQELIDVRIACHPVRLLADCDTHATLPQPMIAPVSMLDSEIITRTRGKALFDYGLEVKEGVFETRKTSCVIPRALVIAYALAALSSGQARHIWLAGFDGYSSDDPRRKEVEQIFNLYRSSPNSAPIISITPTAYEIDAVSIYGL